MNAVQSPAAPVELSAKPSAAQVLHFLTHPRRAVPTADAQAALADAERIDIVHRGIRLAVWAWGQGLPVLLLHGWESQASHMSAYVPPLLQAGFRVLSMDAPCHGASEGTATDAVDYGRAVLSFAAALGDPFAVVGHSVGSAAALYAFSRGVLTHASAHLAGPVSLESALRRGAAAAGLDTTGTQQVLKSMADQIGEPLAVMELPHLSAGFRHRSLILHDPRDKEVPYAESVALARAWPGSRLVPVQGVGHRRILREPSVVEAVVDVIAAARDRP